MDVSRRDLLTKGLRFAGLALVAPSLFVKALESAAGAQPLTALQPIIEIGPPLPAYVPPTPIVNYGTPVPLAPMVEVHDPAGIISEDLLAIIKEQMTKTIDEATVEVFTENRPDKPILYAENS